MLRNVDDLYGFTVRVTDGDIGKVADFLFTDQDLAVRYVLVDTGSWLTGKRVLIGTEALEPIDRGLWEEKILPASLSRAQIESAPDLASYPPMTREQEADLRMHYNLPPYWVGAPFGAGVAAQYPAPTLAIQEEMEHAREHAEAEKEGTGQQWFLRSTKEVAGYSAQATDGAIGRVASFLVDDENWAIQYLIVDTTEWQRGGHVMVPVGSIESIHWSTSDVYFRVSRSQMKNAPPYDRAHWSDPENIRRVMQYYGLASDRDI